jgi:hypothetical protein
MSIEDIVGLTLANAKLVMLTMWNKDKYAIMFKTCQLLQKFHCDPSIDITPAMREKCHVMHEKLCDELATHLDYMP